MNETQLLIGSLSNDLFRISSLTHRGAKKASERFLQESKRWAKSLLDKELPDYLQKIVSDIYKHSKPIDLARAERLLMYAILLQNYSLSLIKGSNKVY